MLFHYLIVTKGIGTRDLCSQVPNVVKAIQTRDDQSGFTQAGIRVTTALPSRIMLRRGPRDSSTRRPSMKLFTRNALLTRLMASAGLLGLLVVCGAQANSSHENDAVTADDTDLVKSGKALTLSIENDLFIGEDNQYTNGFALMYSRGVFEQFDTSNTPAWLLSLVKHTYQYRATDKSRGLVYTLAQQMQTPEDIESTELQTDDVPYAGLLLLGVSTYAVDEKVSDRLALGAGIVGPASLARQSQEIVHEATGSAIPQGWSNQLNNEPVLQLSARRGWRLVATDNSRPVGFDMLGFTEVNLGNLRSAASASVVFRIGDNLQASHATNTLVPDREANTLAFSLADGWYVYAGVESFWVGNDLLIEGNTFSSSHGLKLDRRQDRWGAGAGFNVGKWAFTLVYADLTSNGDSDPFGSLSVTRRF